MKVGIISVNSAHNYGSSMQAFALLAYLRSVGCDAQVINYRPNAIERMYKVLPYAVPKSFKGRVKYCLRFAAKSLRRPYLFKRRKRYESFFTEFFQQTRCCRSLKELRDAKLDFDVAFAGSDQIWNSEIMKQVDPAMFLDFLPERAIKASYAASIGKASLPDEEQAVFAEYLKRLDYISVREEGARQLVQPLTRKPVSVVLDPTLLVERSVYQPLLLPAPYHEDYIYVHATHYSSKAADLIRAAKALSAQTDLPIVHNIQDARFPRQLARRRADGPRETLTVIANAKYVLTQSFHVTVFALCFHKNFITLKYKRTARLEHLLKTVGMSDHFAESPEALPRITSLSTDFDAADRTLAALRKDSCQFIQDVLNGRKCERVPDWFASGDPFTCFGCSACADCCPVNAIRMQTDNEGFVQPRIDETLCTHCGLCQRICPYNQPAQAPQPDRKAYAAYASDAQRRKYATSGGAATELSRVIVEQGGYVAGVQYDPQLRVQYEITHTLEGLEAFKYSKYVEPLHNDVYRKTKTALETGKPVLFIGSPCKVAGLQAYLRKAYDNLFTAEIICACTSSPRMFADYLREKGEQEGAPVVGYNFRSPEGWKECVTTLTYDNGETERTAGRWNPYYHCFVSGYLAKKSCYECPFIVAKSTADVVLGDFWGLEKYVPKGADLRDGVNAILVNTQQGQRLLDMAGDRLTLQAHDARRVLSNNVRWHMDYNTIRAKIFEEACSPSVGVLCALKNHNPRYHA